MGENRRTGAFNCKTQKFLLSFQHHGLIINVLFDRAMSFNSGMTLSIQTGWPAGDPEVLVRGCPEGLGIGVGWAVITLRYF